MSGTWTTTADHSPFWFVDPPAGKELSGVTIGNIAHALAHLCRFNGHLPKFYSVAEHSWWVSILLGNAGASNELQLAGLLHDASEAYTGDIPGPLKHWLEATDPYVEAVLTEVDLRVAEGLGHLELITSLSKGSKYRIKRADQEALVSEGLVFFGPSVVANWGLIAQGHTAPPASIVDALRIREPWESSMAKLMFLDHYDRLCERLKAKDPK